MFIALPYPAPLQGLICLGGSEHRWRSFRVSSLRKGSPSTGELAWLGFLPPVAASRMFPLQVLFVLFWFKFCLIFFLGRKWKSMYFSLPFFFFFSVFLF